MPDSRGFTAVELLVTVGVIAVLLAAAAPLCLTAYERSAIAVTASNIRQLSAGGMQYLADHGHRYWLTVKDRATFVEPDGNTVRGAQWWYGFETLASQSAGEGRRHFDASRSPLAGYIPGAIRPDPSFSIHGRAFKPKYNSGYLGVGYNAVLGGGRGNSVEAKALSYWSLAAPGKTVVFATCAQVNTFQSPASPSRPMLEEFPYFDQKETTIHFIAGNMALVGYADGSGGLLPIDESTRDSRLKRANVGRFAPVGSFQFLK